MGKVVFIACTNVGRSMIEAVMCSEALQGVELVGVVNMSPSAAIGKANYDSYVDLFEKYHIQHYYCESVNEQGCVAFLKNCQPDIIIQSGWSEKFMEKILTIPTYACIGEHPAPLPKGRGAACVNWAIISGEKKWGDTFFKMEMEYDTGVVYSQEYFDIEIYDDVKTVYDKVALASVRAIEKNLRNWTNGILDGMQQDDTKATHYPRRRPEDGAISFHEDTAEHIYNCIRGQAKPYPGAYIIWDNGGEKKKVYMWKARIGDNVSDEEVEVLCKDGNRVILCRVQEEGKPEMWAADYFQAKEI